MSLTKVDQPAVIGTDRQTEELKDDENTDGHTDKQTDLHTLIIL